MPDGIEAIVLDKVGSSARRAGVIADLMHNLALFSALDFAQFEEERFWKDISLLEKRHPKMNFEQYKVDFEMRLSELKKPASILSSDADV
jgi:hypothetical protein